MRIPSRLKSSRIPSGHGYVKSSIIRDACDISILDLLDEPEDRPYSPSEEPKPYVPR